MPISADDTEQLPELTTLWDFGDPASTAERFGEVAGRAREAGDLSYRGQALTQQARAVGLQGRWEDAHAILDRVEALLEEHGAEELPRVRIRYLLERGRACDSPAHKAEDKQAERARRYFQQAWEYGRQTGAHALAVDAAHMLGIIEPPEKALEWNQRAIVYSEQVEDEGARRWLGSLYNNVGWTLHDMGRFKEALALFDKCRAYHEAEGNPRQRVIGHWSTGRALRSLGELDKALEVQQAVLDEWRAIGQQPSGYTYEELGECLLELGREDEARPHFIEAHRSLSQDDWFASEHPDRLARLKALAEMEKED